MMTMKKIKIADVKRTIRQSEGTSQSKLTFKAIRDGLEKEGFDTHEKNGNRNRLFQILENNIAFAKEYRGKTVLYGLSGITARSLEESSDNVHNLSLSAIENRLKHTRDIELVLSTPQLERGKYFSVCSATKIEDGFVEVKNGKKPRKIMARRIKANPTVTVAAKEDPSGVVTKETRKMNNHIEEEDDFIEITNIYDGNKKSKQSYDNSDKCKVEKSAQNSPSHKPRSREFSQSELLNEIAGNEWLTSPVKVGTSIHTKRIQERNKQRQMHGNRKFRSRFKFKKEEEL